MTVTSKFGQNPNDCSKHLPLASDEEWINAMTHAGAAIVGIVATAFMLSAAASKSSQVLFCCLIFGLSSVAVFVASALSHHRMDCPDRLRRFRAWDQGLIYCMIAGTYTPLIFTYGNPSWKIWTLTAMWIAALFGFVSKVFLEHRVNSTGVLSYLTLSWLPALAFGGNLPLGLIAYMLSGGGLYMVGILFLINDRRRRFMHCVWHICVASAAGIHFASIYQYVAC